MASSYTDALSAYRAGVETLHDDVVEVASAAPQELEAPARDLLVQSEEVERTAALGLMSGDADVRELAALQLAAGAALDLAMAETVLGMSEEVEVPFVPFEGSPFDVTYRVLERVLAAEPAFGMRMLPADALPAEQAFQGGQHATLEGLREIADQAINEITATSTRIAEGCVSGLVGLSPHALPGAVLTAADKLLGPVSDRVRGFVRIAFKFVTKAVSKLLRTLGPFEATARTWLVEQLGGLTRGALQSFVVAHVLGVERVRSNVTGTLDDAMRTPERFDREQLETADAELRSLPNRFDKHERVIAIITAVFDRFRAVIVGIAPWVGVALAGVYVLILCYGIWVGGDYLDWFRTPMEGRLDLVDGVRSTVHQALALEPSIATPTGKSYTL